jgi:hypothetical protein
LTSPISGSAFSQNIPKKQHITGEDLVILEDENENNYDDDHLISDNDSMLSFRKQSGDSSHKWVQRVL